MDCYTVHHQSIKQAGSANKGIVFNIQQNLIVFSLGSIIKTKAQIKCVSRRGFEEPNGVPRLSIAGLGYVGLSYVRLDFFIQKGSAKRKRLRNTALSKHI